jgi:DNA-binding MarR family transcriptional regulator
MSKSNEIESFADSLGTQISLVARSLRNALERELASEGVTPSQWMLLMALGAKNHQGQTELGRMVNLDNATITRSLDKLQNLELIVRNQDKDDRRAQVVSLTKKGQRVYKEWNELGKKVNEMASRGLAAGDKKKLLYWLAVITGNLNELNNGNRGNSHTR